MPGGLRPAVQPRPCRVRVTIERPKPAPWISAELPYPERVDWWPGWLLSRRWVDREDGLWTGLVRYSRNGWVYEHSVAGDLIEVGSTARSTGR